MLRYLRLQRNKMRYLFLIIENWFLRRKLQRLEKRNFKRLQKLQLEGQDPYEGEPDESADDDIYS